MRRHSDEVVATAVCAIGAGMLVGLAVLMAIGAAVAR